MLSASGPALFISLTCFDIQVLLFSDLARVKLRRLPTQVAIMKITSSPALAGGSLAAKGRVGELIEILRVPVSL